MSNLFNTSEELFEIDSIVSSIFDSLAEKYDHINDLASFGLHRFWRRVAVKSSDIHCGANVLDLGGGTGELTKLLSDAVGDKGKVTLVDASSSMIKVAKHKLRNSSNVEYTKAYAENLPFSDSTFDFVFVAFCLRNIVNKDMALQSIYRTLKPGGKLVVLDFFQPTNKYLSKLYFSYLDYIVPLLGKWIARDKNSFIYLADSIRNQSSQRRQSNYLAVHGFTNTRYKSLLNGIVAIHCGVAVKSY